MDKLESVLSKIVGLLLVGWLGFLVFLGIWFLYGVLK
jgi:hypothetical protein